MDSRGIMNEIARLKARISFLRDDMESLEVSGGGVPEAPEDGSKYARQNAGWTTVTDGQDGAPGTNGQGVPAGGTVGQLLEKASGTDYDTQWADASGGGSGFDPDIARFTVDTGQAANATTTLDLTADGSTTESTTTLVSGTDITIGFTGWAHVAFGVELNGAVVRAVPEVAVYQNGTRVPGLVAQHTYIRNGNGHTESSANAAIDMAVTDGDVLTLRTVQLAAAGSIVTQANSAITVRRVA